MSINKSEFDKVLAIVDDYARQKSQRKYGKDEWKLLIFIFV